MKSLYIAEKPSVAREFARVFSVRDNKGGYLESEDAVVTWCVGHLVTMSYPEKYDSKYKKWSLETLPFFPDKYKYEVIPSAKKQFDTVSSLLKRDDIGTIYVCTDAGREGEYIYRLVEMMAGPSVAAKQRLRVWIDSQTDDEIRRGVREAKPLSEYDHLSDAAYLRAKEDYLMGINFSRLLTVKYGRQVTDYLGGKWTPISVGRVMTCVLGMVVRREREIRAFVKTPFYKVSGRFGGIEALWTVNEKSAYALSPKLYKENGFRKREDAEELITAIRRLVPAEGIVDSVTKKTEKKNPPLLYNLAEIQNDASRYFKCSPDETLAIIQELYEKKLVTYPRTDARVLSSAVAKEISRNISGLTHYEAAAPFAQEILKNGSYKGIEKSRYTNDKQVTDHYALIPTGQGLSALSSLSGVKKAMYDIICARFLSIFYPAAEYRKTGVMIFTGNELFTASAKDCAKKGYLAVTEALLPASGRKNDTADEDASVSPDLLRDLRKGARLPIGELLVKEGETSPPKRYTGGSMILAMENAGSLIEDEELRAQIRGSGIGTSATRAEILKKLVNIRYLSLHKKTQVLTPTLLGEIVYDTVDASLRQMLNPELTASWEKGLTYVAEGSVSSDEYMQKLESFIGRRVSAVTELHNEQQMKKQYAAVSVFYRNRRTSHERSTQNTGTV